MDKFLQMVDQTTEISNTQQIAENLFKEFLSKNNFGIFTVCQGRNTLQNQILKKSL